jgi:hypothetical protein
VSRPDDAIVRAALKEAGIPVGARGRISDDQYAAYDALAGAAPADDGWPTADIDKPGAGNLGLPEEGGNLGLPPEEPAPAVTMEEEQAPRTVRSGPSAAGRARGLFNRARASAAGGGEPKGGEKKQQGGKRKPAGSSSRKRERPERPWRPTAGLIEQVWTRAAMSAGSIPALQRILAAQAPMSGVVLEGQLRGTLLDKVVLQPVARNMERADAAAALVGVPVLTAMIAVGGRVNMMPGPDGQLYPMFRADGMPDWEPATEMAVGSLRFCLISWLSVTERHGADIIAQAEATVRKGKDADEIIKWIFSPPDPAQTWAQTQREASERMAQAAGFAPPPPPPDGQAPYYPDGPPPGPPSTAFRPAITGSVLPA